MQEKLANYITLVPIHNSIQYLISVRRKLHGQEFGSKSLLLNDSLSNSLKL